MRVVASHRRSGLASVAVLIALIIVGIICAALLKVGLARRSNIQVRERSIQAEWLAESGIDRASARLGREVAYTGETWEIPTEDLGNRGTGTVTIRVEPVEGQPDRRRVQVSADFPSGAVSRARRSKIIIVEVPHTPR